jgi:hypothetical protein
MVGAAEEQAGYMRPLEHVSRELGKVVTEKSGPVAGKVAGAWGEVVEGADRGFDAAKYMRLKLFEKFMKEVPEKLRPEAAKGISDLVKSMTGRSELPLGLNKASEWLNVPFFAARYNWSKFQFLFVEPVKMGYRLATPRTPGHIQMAKIAAKQYAKYVALYGTALGVNKVFNDNFLAKRDEKGNIIKDPATDVNLLDPTKADWLRFKIGGRVWDNTGNLNDPVRLIARVADAKKEEPKPGEKAKSTWMSGADITVNWLRGKLTPVASAMADVYDKEDFMGNPLPHAGPKQKAKALQRGNRPWSWADYVRAKVTPMGIQGGIDEYTRGEFMRSLNEEMKKEDVPPPLRGAVIQTFFEFFGMRTYVPSKSKPNTEPISSGSSFSF